MGSPVTPPDPAPAKVTPREAEILALLPLRLSNSAIAAELFISDPAVGKHVGNILAKLGLPPTDDTNRRVMAVLTFLRAR